MNLEILGFLRNFGGVTSLTELKQVQVWEQIIEQAISLKSPSIQKYKPIKCDQKIGQTFITSAAPQELNSLLYLRNSTDYTITRKYQYYFFLGI